MALEVIHHSIVCFPLHWGAAAFLCLIWPSNQIIQGLIIAHGFDSLKLEKPGTIRCVLACVFLRPPLSVERDRQTQMKARPESVEHDQAKLDAHVSEVIGAGVVLGGLERTLIVVLLLVEGYSAVGFIMAAKGLIINALGSTSSNYVAAQKEHYLLGTFASFAIAFLTAIGLSPYV